ncbi:MAG: sugar-binding transcriptional regulator [Bacillota bacterium]
MEQLFEIFQRLTPDLIDCLQVRYNILRKISLHQPVGRRSLATMLGLSERVLRSEVDRLKDAGLVVIGPLGIALSQEGDRLLERATPWVYSLSGLTDLELRLARKLGLKAVHVVDGDSDVDQQVKRALGRRTAELIQEQLSRLHVIAVAGGSTIAEVAEAMPQISSRGELMVVPARGGLGEGVEIQASTIAATLARRLSGQYRLLHVPDNLSHEAMQSLISEPGIAEVLALIRGADLLVHGIGGAAEMARRRRSTDDEIRTLLAAGAMGEAFGFFFNRSGEIVHSVASVGLGLQDINHIPHRIAVAGGSQKAEAICAVLKGGASHVLVTDEGAARRMDALLS